MCAGVPSLRWCHSVTGEHGCREQAPAVVLPTSHFQRHFLCPPNPCVLQKHPALPIKQMTVASTPA